jgi:RHS repeat-associated protein
VNTYGYDAADHLISYVNGESNAISTFAYNGMGDRYQQIANGVQTNYLLDLNSSLTQVLGEFRPGDETYYLLGLDVIGQQQNGTWGYFGYDGLGSVREVTDNLGALQFATSYAPYGSPFEQFSTPSTSLGFTGEMTDPSGLLYLRARYMSPDFGSFLTKDPFPGIDTMAMSQNGYSYVHGNPVNYTDPSGKFIFAVVGFALMAFGVIGLGMMIGRAIGTLVGGAIEYINQAIELTRQCGNNATFSDLNWERLAAARGRHW